MAGHMRATCPECGHTLTWHHDNDPPDELAKRIRTLEAERLRPAPKDLPRRGNAT